ncbi:hypothetical protein DFH28DRAFT_907164 [Melampsora americana]|nr:hypothetical protein DFH28DRAFT_907164 [Melampsora americana]
MNFKSKVECFAFKPEHHQFSLPTLTHLKSWPDSRCWYIQCFSNCKDLCHITFDYFIRSKQHLLSDYMSHIRSFEGLVQSSNFISRHVYPKLKVINLPIHLPLDPIEVPILVPLGESCKSNGMHRVVNCISHPTFHI